MGRRMRRARKRMSRQLPMHSVPWTEIRGMTIHRAAEFVVLL
jgi:hypothetical protein